MAKMVWRQGVSGVEGAKVDRMSKKFRRGANLYALLAQRPGREADYGRGVATPGDEVRPPLSVRPLQSLTQ